MNMTLLTEITQYSILITLKISAPILIISLAVGLLISIVQTTTSIQEQTLTFVPKIIAIMLTIFVGIFWMANELIVFTDYLFDKIPQMAR